MEPLSGLTQAEQLCAQLDEYAARHDWRGLADTVMRCQQVLAASLSGARAQGRIDERARERMRAMLDRLQALQVRAELRRDQLAGQRRDLQRNRQAVNAYARIGAQAAHLP